jgi:tetratricopeptide (TPR) repeat protein
VILERLDGLPLALSQAGAYIGQTGFSALAYAKHYDETWKRLMKKEGQFPLEEYGDRNVLTTWTLSYEQVQKQSEEAACLLQLWGFLDYGELWYELLKADLGLSEQIEIPGWLVRIAQNELEFANAVGLLLRYSLADSKEGTSSYSMHSVLHKWCGQLAEDEERYSLCCLAAGLVASHVPSELEPEYLKKSKRVLAHGFQVSIWIVEGSFSIAGGAIETHVLPWALHKLGRVLFKGDIVKQAEKMYQRALQGYEKAWGLEHTSTLDTVNNLGNLYLKLGRLDEAEKMYQRALQGKEKAWGLEHTSTLDTVNNLGALYADLGRLDEAEKMYQRALQGYEKAWGLEHTSTLDTVNNLGLLYAGLGRLDEAEKMYQRALQGYEKAIGPKSISTYIPALNNKWAIANLSIHQGHIEDARIRFAEVLLGYQKVYGNNHPRCRELRDFLAELDEERGQSNVSSERVLDLESPHVETTVDPHPSQSNASNERVSELSSTQVEITVDSHPSQNKPLSRRRKFLGKLGLRLK